MIDKKMKKERDREKKGDREIERYIVKKKSVRERKKEEEKE